MSEKRDISLEKDTKEKKGAEVFYKQHRTLGLNLHNLKEITGDNQSEIAEKCGLHETTLGRYISCSLPIAFKAILPICSVYGYTLDEFVFDNLLEKKSARLHRDGKAAVYEYYEGTYLAYLRSAQNDQLKYGVISLYCEGLQKCLKDVPAKSIKELSSPQRNLLVGEFFNDKQKAIQRKRVIDDEWKKPDLTFHSIVSKFEDAEKLYNGQFEITDNTISIQLKSVYYDDYGLILLPDHRKRKEYVGGIGIIISNVKVGKGINTLPCAQKILLSKQELTVDEEYIFDALSIDYHPSISNIDSDWTNLSKRVLAWLKMLDLGDLNDEEMLFLVEKYLHNACKLQLNSIRMPFFLVSPEDDRKGYDLIKESTKKE